MFLQIPTLGDLSTRQVRLKYILTCCFKNSIIKRLNDKEIISIEEAIKNFKLRNVGKSPAIIDEKKINFLNSHYFKNKSEKYLSELLSKELKKIKLYYHPSKKKLLNTYFQN